MPSSDCDVLICGLGPVGQLLALLLGRRGVSVIAIDEAPGPFDLPRAAVIDDEVLRIFQAAGIRDRILEQSQPQDEVTFVPGHGPSLTLLEPDGTMHGQHGLVSIHQPSMEKAIVEAVSEVPGVETRWNCRLDDFCQEPPGIRASVRGDSGDEQIRARWMVGCDGGNSRVRQLLGIEFGGSTFRQRWLVVDVRLDRPLARVRHPHFFGDPGRPIVCLPMSPGRHRWEWMVHPGEDEGPMLDPASIRERLDPWLGDEQATVERAAIYTFHRRTAARWRDGRVFLAGDAAHLMPPFAGQGFSSGARDAANLSWKLEATLVGAPESLLDSYERERRPHVQAMGRLAVTLGRFVQTNRPSVAFARDLGLRLLEVSGINEWSRERIKPVPAFGEGAFATPPSKLAFLRKVGSQFPQVEVRSGEEMTTLDEMANGGWLGIAMTGVAKSELEHAGLRVLTPGPDFEDTAGMVTEWFRKRDASWLIMRPDQYVYALGSASTEVRSAAAQLRRDLGRGASHL